MARTSRQMLGVAVAAVAVAAVAWGIRAGTSRAPAPHPAGTAGPQARPVPVVVAPVVRRDVPIYLEGLGNAAASMTVTVKTQLDGRLDQVLFTEGQTVRRGQLLARIDPRPYQVQLEQGQGALARDQAQLRNAQLNVDRDRKLVASKLIAQQQLDTDTAAVGQLQGAVQMDRATVDSARLNLEYARITSPLDGVTGVRQVDPGNVVHPTDANGIVVVTKLDPIAVLFTLPQDQLTPVLDELGRTGTLPVDVYGRDGTTLLGSGRVTLVDNQINQTTSTIRLKAEVPNPRRLLWPNQFVNVRLHLTTRKDALTVPTPALQRGPEGTFVYVVGAEATAAPRPVTVAATQGELAIVASGLAPGERVVTDGQNQLRPGSPVVAREQPAPEGHTAAAAGGSAVEASADPASER